MKIVISGIKSWQTCDVHFRSRYYLTYWRYYQGIRFQYKSRTFAGKVSNLPDVEFNGDRFFHYLLLSILVDAHRWQPSAKLPFSLVACQVHGSPTRLNVPYISDYIVRVFNDKSRPLRSTQVLDRYLLCAQRNWYFYKPATAIYLPTKTQM